MNQQPYAPTPGTYRPSYAAQTSSIPLNEEQKLYSTLQERELHEALAEVYSIIVTLDMLEKAYLRDAVPAHEYTPACLRLIAQYNMNLKNEAVAESFGDIDSFKAKYGMHHPNATARLKVGVPATVEHAIESSHARAMASPAAAEQSSGSGGISAKAVAEATGNFITTMDGLKLNFKAKDQLHPLLGDLVMSLNKVTSEDFEGRGKLVQWLITLNGMKANEELSDGQTRDFLFDLNQAYNAFVKILE
ncbi:vacuolar protein sorting-associated protein 28 [Trichomonascus vanleenenianus]|uniref:ESCRT-I subunit protein VPS28 n=1 Tax=Trichomonascus vanleenenianus TaxID=2268995 RepID=UPI003ECB3ABC